MPIVNYARNALIQHCLDVNGGNPDAAAATLDAVVRENKDFLVRFAVLPHRSQEMTISMQNFLARFDAKTWVNSYLHRAPPGATYSKALARAYLLVPGLALPESVWLSFAFQQSFKDEARAVMQQRRPPRTNNFQAVREDPYAGPVFCMLEERVPDELRKCNNLYESLVNALQSELAPCNTLGTLLGFEKMRQYKQLLVECGECCDGEIDVEGALQAGAGKRNPGWNSVTCERLLGRLELYVRCKQGGMNELEIGEAHERHIGSQTARNKESTAAKAEQAAALGGGGVWRIRAADYPKWSSALSAQEWETYRQCERAMRNTLPQGVWTHVRRRHFNKESLRAMQTENLERLCKAFSISLVSGR